MSCCKCSPCCSVPKRAPSCRTCEPTAGGRRPGARGQRDAAESSRGSLWIYLALVSARGLTFTPEHSLSSGPGQGSRAWTCVVPVSQSFPPISPKSCADLPFGNFLRASPLSASCAPLRFPQNTALEGLISFLLQQHRCKRTHQKAPLA